MALLIDPVTASALAAPCAAAAAAEPRRLRVLMVVDNDYPALGGAEIQARTLSRALQARGHEVELLCYARRPGLPAHDSVDGVPVVRLRYPHWPKIGALVLLLRFAAFLLARRARYDAIHVHIAGHLAAVVGLLRPWLRAVTLVKVSGATEFDGGLLDPAASRRWGNRLQRRLLRRLHAVQAVSDQALSRLRAAGLPEAAIRCIPNAVDTRHFAAAPRRLPPGACAEVIYMGRLEHVKGVDVLLHAWRSVAAACAARLTIVGGGRRADDYRALAEALGLGDSVRFESAVADPSHLLRGAHVYVQPSRQEGLSNAVLEAMACGLPIVATQVSGSADLVQPGINGLVVPPADAAALARALTELLQAGPPCWQRMGAASRQRVDERYALPVVLDALERLYRGAPDAGLTVQHLHDASALEALHDDWEDLFRRSPVRSVFSSPDWQRLWWRHYGAGRPLRVIALRSGRRLAALLPMYLDTVVVCGLPVRRLRLIGCGGDTAPDDLQPLVDPVLAAEAVPRLLAELGRLPDWDACLLEHLHADGPWAAEARRQAPARRWRMDEGPRAAIRHVQLPSSWDAYLAQRSRERRTALRYARRRFMALPGAGWRTCTEADLDDGIDRLQSLHHLRWNGRSAQFAFSSQAYRAFHREVMHALQRAGRLRLHLLDCDGRSVAAMYCLQLDGTTSHFQGGFDPAYAKYSPGQVLMGLAFEQAIAEGCERFDLLRGDHAYKAEWADEQRLTTTLVLHRGGLRGRWHRLRTQQLPRLKRLLAGGGAGASAAAQGHAP